MGRRALTSVSVAFDVSRVECFVLPFNPRLMMSHAKLQIAHQVPGRVRMKIPAGKGNPELLEQMKQTLVVIPGIEEVIINPDTGSLGLHYDTDRHDEFHGH